MTPEFKARRKQQEEEDELLSLVVRWGLGSWRPPDSRPATKDQRAHRGRPDLSSRVCVETESFVAFVSELKDRRVGQDSHVVVKDETAKRQAESDARDQLHYKTLHWTLPAPFRQFDGVVAVLDRAPEVDDLQRWKKLLKPERAQLAREKTVVVIFPAEHLLSMQRLCQEFGLEGLGPTKLDDLYFKFDPAHRFLRQRFGRALSEAHFQFLARWSYASFSLRNLTLPASTPAETTLPALSPSPTTPLVPSSHPQTHAPPSPLALQVLPDSAPTGIPGFLSGGYLQTNPRSPRSTVS
jgi:hypothetical protein